MKCRDEQTGNCTSVVGADGLPVQCVGPWALDKHYYIRTYVGATRNVRGNFHPPKGHGGTTFIDLYSGPGLAYIPDGNEFIQGSPLIALEAEEHPYSKVILCDIDEKENIPALRKRTAKYGSRVQVIPGDCNEVVDQVLAAIPTKWSYNVALVDPFGPGALSFETIRRLSKPERMDMIFHFPIGGMKRIFKKHIERLERFIGLPKNEWGVDVVSGPDVSKLLPVFQRQLEILGYPIRELLSPPIKNTKNLPLYHLVFATRHERGEEIWKSITRKTPSGQREFAFG